MKYDFELNLNENDAVAMLLRHVRPHSKVLEFGCANGRMTKYMQEKLFCEVYIVEYDQNAFEEAIVYAKDGLCDDIMTLQWKQRFKSIAFDAVIFADVLEHLSDPEKILTHATEVMTPDGVMLVSLPNVAHNDVVYGLLNDRFHYTNIGLLDNTHIHFFAYQELDELFTRAGLFIVQEDGSVLARQRTEMNQDGSVWNIYDRLLQQRSLGNVYQFVIKAVRKEYAQLQGLEKQSSLQQADCYALGKIYFDTGSGFSEDMCSLFHITQKHSKIYQYVRLPAGTKQVRVDPVENAYCRLTHWRAWTDAGFAVVTGSNGIEIGEVYAFSTTDPWLIVSVSGATEWIKFSADVHVLQDSEEEEFLAVVKQNFAEEQAKVQQTKVLMASKDEEYARTVHQLQMDKQEQNQKLAEIQQHAEEFHMQKLYFEQQLAVEQQKVAQMHEQHAAMDQQRAEAQQQTELLRAQKHQIEQQLEVEQQKVVQMHEQYAVVDQQRAEAQQQAEQLQVQKHRIEQQLAAEQDKLCELKKRNAVLEQENASMRIEIANLTEHIANLTIHKNFLERRITEDAKTLQQHKMLQQSEEKARLDYEAIVNSDYWKLTAPARVVTSKLRSIMGFNKPETDRNVLIRGLLYLKRNGVHQTFRRILQEYRLPSGEIRKGRKQSELFALMPNLPFVYSDNCHKTKIVDAMVSVVIPTKNGGEDFGRLLKTLRRQKGFREIEIVIVDSGSTDETLTSARQHKAQIIRIKPEEFSHSYARNLGVSAAKGDYVLVMTQDAMPTSDYWMYNLYLALTHADDIGAVSCAEYARADSDMYHRVFAWNHYRYLGADEKNIIMKKPDSTDIQEIRRNAQLSDITCMMPKAIAEKYPYQGSFAEDLDLGMRLINDGYRLGFLGTEVAIHSHNRGAYYYLRRRFVEFVTLKEMFPEQEVIPYHFDQVVKEATFIFCQLAQILTDMIHGQMIPLKEFQTNFRDRLYSLRSMTFPSQLVWTAALDNFVDPEMEKVMCQLLERYNAADYVPNEKYSGSLIDSIDGYIGICYLYMDTCYEYVNADVIGEFRDCLGKILASAMGTFFAYCYYTDPQERDKHQAFYQKIGAGV